MRKTLLLFGVFVVFTAALLPLCAAVDIDATRTAKKATLSAEVAAALAADLGPATAKAKNENPYVCDIAAQPKSGQPTASDCDIECMCNKMMWVLTYYRDTAKAAVRGICAHWRTTSNYKSIDEQGAYKTAEKALSPYPVDPLLPAVCETACSHTLYMVLYHAYNPYYAGNAPQLCKDIKESPYMAIASGGDAKL
eukprot:PLAT14481.1.p1 GENE.PLAT14481.1~~PLAT14481.1.p1  ORF type:complete len:208 (+),score=61.37 PLAT14481.1:40-624(+)